MNSSDLLTGNGISKIYLPRPWLPLEPGFVFHNFSSPPEHLPVSTMSGLLLLRSVPQIRDVCEGRIKVPPPFRNVRWCFPHWAPPCTGTLHHTAPNHGSVPPQEPSACSSKPMWSGETQSTFYWEWFLLEFSLWPNFYLDNSLSDPCTVIFGHILQHLASA